MNTKKRFVFAFPESSTFFERVHDRLHTVVERYVYQSEKNAKFTLFISAFPREGGYTFSIDEDVQFKYVSIPKQKELLEEGKEQAYLKEHWDKLTGWIVTSELAKEGSTLYDIIKENKFEFKDIPKGTLEEYFSENLNDTQKEEQPILKHYFNIKGSLTQQSDRFVSIPLLQLGDVDGFVHIVYEAKDHQKYNEDNIKDLVIGFSIEYEGVILAWDLAYNRYDRALAMRETIELIARPEYFADRNPIFQQLGYPEYYRKHYPYFSDRLKMHEDLLDTTYEQLVKNGAITILLDSYAHNISAHALTTLTWIFKKRTQLKLKEKEEKELASSVEKAVKNTVNGEGVEADHYKALIEYTGSLTPEIYPFLKFLQEKGGFWSGLIRDRNNSGQISTLYSVLWYDFIANALYLGTIAESENIRRLHVDLTFYPPVEDVVEDKAFVVENKPLKTLRFATIDLEKEVKHPKDPKKGYYVLLPDGKTPIWYEDNPELEYLSRFVQPGQDFPELKEALRKVNIFFPGGIVGKQAFFTLIENELRNIKHYFGDVLTKAQDDQIGMTLNISLQPASLGKGGRELYRIGLWLGLESDLATPDRENPYLVKRRFDMLWDDIVTTETSQPVLGGSNQDKVCAALLFNGKFSSVQQGSFRNLAFKTGENRQQLRDAIFYPWITPAVCYKDSTFEFQVPVSAANFSWSEWGETGEPSYLVEARAFKEDIESNYRNFEKQYANTENQGKGHLKKYLYLWRGVDIREDQNLEQIKWDNLGRFKFILAKPGKLWDKSRRNGIIRLIGALPVAETASEEERLLAAYKQWFNFWIGEEQLAFYFTDEAGTTLGAFLFRKNATSNLLFYSDFPLMEKDGWSIQKEMTEESLKEIDAIVSENPVERDLHCAHSSNRAGEDAIRYRRHGVLFRHFIVGEKSDLALNRIPSAKMAELFEVMATRICIFDGRLEKRLGNKRVDLYRDKMKIFYGPENPPEKIDDQWTGEWESADTKFYIRHCHFLVIHLSYIDKILQKKYASEKSFESNIGLFVEKEVKPIVGTSADEKSLRENFVLVLTTGRGRQNWLESLKQDEYKMYRKNIIFRPVESLIAAVEDGIMIDDDFELKYRLTKVLFGS